MAVHERAKTSHLTYRLLYPAFPDDHAFPYDHDIAVEPLDYLAAIDVMARKAATAWQV